MDFADLFVALAAAGATLELANGKLRAGPSERLTDELRSAIREHRELLLSAACEVCGAPTAGHATCNAHDPFGLNSDES